MSKPDSAPQSRSLPLSAKILLWFFLNVAFLALVGWIFARAQFGPALNMLFVGRGAERVQAMARAVAGELDNRPRDEWDAVLARFSSAYQSKIALYRDDGAYIAGSGIRPPETIVGKISSPPAFRPPPPDRSRDHGPPPPFPKEDLHTDQPSLYWSLIRLPLRDRGPRLPVPTTLLIASETPPGGESIFEFVPLVIGSCVVLALSALLWFPLVRGITRSLRQMTDTAENIARGRFDTHVATTRGDELGRLAHALNHMAARLQEFFTGQKRFLGDIAHELCSPLARMEVALSILEQRVDEKQRTYIEDVREETRQMSALVDELLSFSKAVIGGKDVRLKAVPLPPLVREVLRREAIEEAKAIVEMDDSLVIWSDPTLTARAIGNVVRNARRYAGKAGPIRLSAVLKDRKVRLSVTDCGPGVKDEILHRLFDPFFRPEASRSRDTGGAGLGLAIVKSCVEACGGSVSLRNVQPSGLRVEFVFQRPPSL